MKKFTKVFIVFCLMLMLVLSLAACATSGTLGKDEQGRFKLAAPEITISNNLVSWKSVRYCTTYGVKIDDEKEVEVKSTYYTLLGDKDVASVTVRAIGDGETTVTSPYSNSVSYTAKKRLANPQEPTLTEEGGNIVLSWNAISNATSYVIEQSQKIATGISTYTSSTNSLVIEKSKFEETDVYYFRVMAHNNTGNFLSSGYSVKSSYKKTEQLQTIVPMFNGSNIKWEEVPNATNYRVYLQKYAGEGANEDKILVSTLSSSSRDYSNVQVTSAVTKYKEEWEKKNSGQKMVLAGDYKIFMQAINSTHPEIYLENELVEVKKVVEGGDNQTLEDIVFKKPAKVSNVKQGKQTIVINEDTQETKEVDMLTWECDDFDKFKIKFYSNGALLIDGSASAGEGKNREDNLTSRFSGEYLKHAGKVVEMSVTVQADFANGILEGEETFWLVDGTEQNAQYCYIPESLEQNTSEDSNYKDYYKIKNLGDLRYMLDDTKLSNRKFYLTADIDGMHSSTNANFYFGSNAFDGVFDGCGHVISNVNFIFKDQSQITASLFSAINENSVFKNVSFNNVTITIEDMTQKTVALIAQTNNGTIERVNILNSTFNTKGKTAGFVGTNNGAINSCGFLGNKISAIGYNVNKEGNSDGMQSTNAVDAAAIALVNNSNIFNASVYDTDITGATRFENARVGGIVVENNGQISNSFVKGNVKNSMVCATTSANDEKEVFALAGGIAAENNGGTICQSYVARKASGARAVDALSSRWQGTNGTINAVAGGLVGKMNGGTIEACYIRFARISSSKTASGLIGDKTDAAINITNCYVFNITFASATERAMVLTKTEGVTANNVYCVVINANPTNTNNAEVVANRSQLINKDLGEYFVKNLVDFSEEPILKNMIYSNDSTSNLSVYIVTLDNNKVVLEPTMGTDVGTKRLDIYSFEVSEDMLLVFPIFKTK